MQHYGPQALAYLRTMAGLCLVLVLVACGGGSDAGSPEPPNSPPVTPPITPPVTPPLTPPVTPPVTPPTPPSTAFSVSFATTSLGLTADTSSNSAADQQLNFTVANAPAGSLWYRANISGVGVREVSMSFTTATEGRMRLVMYNPGQLGAGTYVSTVPIEFCSTSTCSSVLGGPYNITVTYTVTGSALPTTRVFIPSGPSVATTHSVTQATSPVKTYAITIENLPLTGLWIRRSLPSDGIVLGSVLRDIIVDVAGSTAHASLDVTAAPPASLGSGVKTGHLRVRACFDADCNRVVPNSEVDIYPNFIIHAQEGMHFTRRILKPSNGATDVVWAPLSGSLYVASSIGFTSDAAILQVDPATGTIAQSVVIPGQDLGRLALTDDGSRLFVSAVLAGPQRRNGATVRRLTLPALVEEAVVTLDQSTAVGSLPVRELAAMPGDNGSFVASLGMIDTDEGIFAYDTARKPNGVPRVSVSSERGRYFTPGAAPGILHSLRHLSGQPYTGSVEKLRLDSTGVHVIGSVPLSANVRAVHFGGGKLFALHGPVLDADTGAVLGQLQIPDGWTMDAMAVDESRSRIYGISQNEYVLSFDMNTFRLLAIAPSGVTTQRATFDHHIMKLWGSEGLVLVDGTNLIVLSGPFFTTYDGAPTMPVPPPLP